MPNIRQYDNPINGLQPDDKAALAYAYAGRSIAGNYDEIGRALGGAVSDLGHQFAAHEAKKDIAAGAARRMVIQDHLTQELSKQSANADLNDENVLNQYKQETLEPTLQSFVDGFKTKEGKEWAQMQAASLREHMYGRVASAQAARAGAALGQNLDLMQTHATNIAAQDPGSVPLLLDTARATVEALITSTPGLTPEQIATIRTEGLRNLQKSVVHAAIVSAIDADPAGAQARIEASDVSEYLTADEKHTLVRYAEQVSDHAEVQARADEQRVKATQRDTASQYAAHITAGFVGENGEPQVPADFATQLNTYLALPQSDDGTGRALIGMARSITNELATGIKVKDDPATYSAFVARIGIPQGQPHALSAVEIDQARGQGLLSDKSRTFLNSAIRDTNADPSARQLNADTRIMFNGIKGMITKSNLLAGSDPTGDAMYAAYQRDILDQVNALRAGGMSAADITRRYLTPSSAEFLGRQEIISRYSTSQQTSISNILSRANGEIPTVLYPGIQVAPVAPAGAPAGAPAAAADAPMKQPGETMQAFAARAQAYIAAHPSGGATHVIENTQEIARRQRLEAAEAARGAASRQRALDTVQQQSDAAKSGQNISGY